MHCEAFADNLDGYLREKLPAEKRAALEAHRSSCSHCADLHAMATELSCRELAGFLDVCRHEATWRIERIEGQLRVASSDGLKTPSTA